jgi:hypothetical protein
MAQLRRKAAMQDRIPSRENAPGQPEAPQGNTIPQQGQTDTQERVPRMPHERDESADSQPQAEPSSRRVADAALADVESGRVDTDKGPVMDQTYDRVREGADDPVKKFRP